MIPLGFPAVLLQKKKIILFYSFFSCFCFVFLLLFFFLFISLVLSGITGGQATFPVLGKIHLRNKFGLNQAGVDRNIHNFL